VVLLVSYGDIDFLLTGDIQERAESAIVARGEEVAAEILKVPHHGSSTSSSPDFLTAVSPSEAIISADPTVYGHPHDETLQRLANVGANIWRTDEDGTIIVTTNGITYTIRADLRTTPATTPTGTVAPWHTLFMPLILRVPAPSVATPTLSPTPSVTATLTPTPTYTPRATATLSPTATPTESGGGDTVYITNTGTKYHRDGCRYLSESKIPKTCAWVKANGYEACKVCEPYCP